MRSAAFEPLETISLRQLTKKTLFLLALASARRIGEIQSLSKEVSFRDNSAFVAYTPEFVAKTESEANPIPRFFEIKSLDDFAGDLPEDKLLCPVRCLKTYLLRTRALLPHPRTLFVSPKSPLKPISKNAISFFLKEVILQACPELSSPGPLTGVRAHSIRAMSTSAAFMKNVSIRRILEAATWKSSSVFSSFYLKDIQFSSSEGFSLGPVVAANAVINI